MRIALIAALVVIADVTLLSAQQPVSPAATLQINLPEVVAEVTAAHDRYNNAINARDDAVLLQSFHNDDRTIRYGLAENLYGYKEIEGFRAAGGPPPTGAPPRTLSKTVITTYGRDFAVASTLYHRANTPSRVGRQMQTWARFPDGWRIIAAHVSVIDSPK
jgi:hypothetical protein